MQKGKFIKLLFEMVCFCIEQSFQFRYMPDKKCLPIQDRIYLEVMTKRLFNVY